MADVTITPLIGDRYLVELREDTALYRIQLSAHGLRDFEFEAARERAMSRRCTVTDGEHTCALAPGHGAASHLCRGCTKTWQNTG